MMRRIGKSSLMMFVMLFAALAIVGVVRANHSGDFWSQAGFAEEAEEQLVIEVGQKPAAPNPVWESTLADVVTTLDSDDITVQTRSYQDYTIQCVSGEDVPVSDFTADTKKFFFHDDVLCFYTYTFKEDCSKEAYEYMKNAMKEKYGEPSAQDPADAWPGSCAVVELLMSGATEEKKDDNWLNNALDYVSAPFLSEATDYCTWTVGGDTQIVMHYNAKNSFLASESFVITYINTAAHGPNVVVEEPVEVIDYNTDGL